VGVEGVEVHVEIADEVGTSTEEINPFFRLFFSNVVFTVSNLLMPFSPGSRIVPHLFDLQKTCLLPMQPMRAESLKTLLANQEAENSKA
jgi:hypothetical protein